MATSRKTAAALADISSSNGTTAVPCRLAAIEIQPHESQTNTVYIQLFNALASNVTLGTTAPVMVIPVFNRSAVGGPASSTRRYKVLFPGGRFRFSTSLSAAVTTTHDGNTVASGTSLPAEIRYFFVP